MTLLQVITHASALEIFTRLWHVLIACLCNLTFVCFAGCVKKCTIFVLSPVPLVILLCWRVERVTVTGQEVQAAMTGRRLPGGNLPDLAGSNLPAMSTHSMNATSQCKV